MGIENYLIKNSPAEKKCVPPKNAVVRKKCEIQRGSQETPVMVGCCTGALFSSL